MFSVQLSELKQVSKNTQLYDVSGDIEFSERNAIIGKFSGDMFRLDTSVSNEMFNDIQSKLSDKTILNDVSDNGIKVPVTVRHEKLKWSSRISFDEMKIKYGTGSIPVHLTGTIHLSVVCTEQFNGTERWMLRGVFTSGELVKSYINSKWV